MITSESGNDKSKRFQWDYNEIAYKRSFFLYDTIKNLKICLECKSRDESNNNHADYNISSSYIKLKQEVDIERIESLRYQILEDLQQFGEKINFSDFLPDHYVKVTITPRFGKDGINAWR
jgi:hypothetical protein